MLINAVVIILILIVWMMVAGSIAPDLVILGQSLAAWSVLITVVGGVYLYRQLLTFLRARAHPPESQPTKSTGPFFNYRIGTLCPSHRDARNRGDGAKTIKGRQGIGCWGRGIGCAGAAIPCCGGGWVQSV